MKLKHNFRRVAAAFLAAGALTFAVPAAAAAQATESIEKSGHTTCPAGQQVRVFSVSNGGHVSQYWSATNDAYGSDVRAQKLWGVDMQTFTLERDVYWRVVVEGIRPTLHTAGGACF